MVGPAAAIERVANDPGRTLLFDARGQPLILFDSEWSMQWTLDKEREVTFHDVAP